MYFYRKEYESMCAVTESFQMTCRSLGYREHSAVPIFPCVDPTTLFVGSTISVLKNHLVAGALCKISLVQPCLRTQNLKRILESGFDPEYLSSFVMLGILASPQNFVAQEEVPHFFEAFPGLSEKILVRSSRAIEDTSFLQIARSYRVEYDTREPRYYKWQYGEHSLSGVGLTFALKQPDDTYLDVGNLVRMYQDKNLCAIEFGFGLETFTARLVGRGSPYAVAHDYVQLGLDLSQVGKCIADCLVVAKKLAEAGVVPDSGRASSVLRKALRSACFLAIRKYGDNAEDKVCGAVCRCAVRSARWLELVCRTFREVRGALASFQHEVIHMRRHAYDSYLEQKINEYRIRYGIPDAFEV